MIHINDFSEETMFQYTETRNGNVSVFDFATRLLASDFDKKGS